ncbi:MAG: response regulator transcription factor [Oscillatoriales cyanobacterium SM2_2_1]|nr:response regulator transcription factor [Oscillatoriales cyanobacterium SM2_2_1]
MHILLVEDDAGLAETMAEILQAHHCLVDVANDGQTGLSKAQSEDYNLILLDVMLPHLDGISLCKELRSLGNQVPILMMTALDTSRDKVRGLDSGADDYIVKPVDPQELMARIRALSRRAQISETEVLHWGELQLDPALHEVTYAAQPIHLTPKEYNILQLLMHNGRQVLKRLTIVEHVWSLEDPPREDTINATIKSLRNKLKSVGAPHSLIETIHGVGYRLSQPETQVTEASSSQ